MYSQIRRNDGVLSVKSKSKKRFNFPKKLKNVTNTKASNVPFNVVQVLSPHGIQQVRNIIAFLMLNHSEFKNYTSRQLLIAVQSINSILFYRM